MLRLIASRLVQGVMTMALAGSLVFLVARFTGDPVTAQLGIEGTAEQRVLLREELGLDRPLAEQYTRFLMDAATGDFGDSYRTDQPVGDLLWPRLGKSAQLGMIAMSVAIVIAIPMGVLSATRRGSLADRTLSFLGVLGQTVPLFWLGLILILIFSVRLRWLPTSGFGGWQHYILPVVTLSSFMVAGMMRLTRSSMLEALETEYVKFARVRGIAEWRIVWLHALRNAISAPVTFASIYLGLLIGQAIVIETIFNWPGMGRLAYDSIRQHDLPVLQGAVMLSAAIVVVVGLITDLLYAVIDPRIRYR